MLPIGVVVERRKLASPWADHAWLPVAVLPGVPTTPPWTSLGGDDQRQSYYAGAAELALYRSDTANYRDNLASGRPSLWVALREVRGTAPVAVLVVTADPAEGEALTEAGGDIVEPVPMPAEIEAWIAEFVQAHHVERSFYKRRRDTADPDALGPRPPGGSRGRTRD
jgi:hypothetical protein